MALHPLTETADESLVNAEADDVIDLTDRRRMFVRLVFGVDIAPTDVDGLFDPDADGAPTLT